jgi:hypothetical protein
MNDEALQKLFEEIRNTPPETGVNEVSGWLDAASAVSAGTGVSTRPMIMKITTITSMLAITILGAIYITSADKDAEKSIIPIYQLEKAITNPTKPPLAPQPGEKEKFKNDTISLPNDGYPTDLQPVDDFQESPIPQTEHKIITLPVIQDISDTIVAPEIQANEATSGKWRSFHDSLYIDTIFNGVKKLIFAGRIANKIMVVGDQRNNVSMTYSYSYRAKGIFVGKSQCEVGFQKVDSVLTIQVEQKSTVNVGVSFTKLASSMTFEVPENIAIEVTASYGDIEIKEMRDNRFLIKTAYGDIKARSVKGTAVLGTNYGDIFLDRIHGNIESTTNHGDIKGINLTGLEMVSLRSNHGDIEFQLDNPISDCKLDLKTGYGRIRVDRRDLEMESSKRLTLGKGPTKVFATANFGDVFIK